MWFYRTYKLTIRVHIIYLHVQKRSLTGVITLSREVVLIHVFFFSFSLFLVLNDVKEYFCFALRITIRGCLITESTVSISSI